MCKDFEPNFGGKELDVALRQRTVSHFRFTGGFFTQINMTLTPHPLYSSDLAPCDFSASPIKAKTKRPPF
jgi:hypothetical protein